MISSENDLLALLGAMSGERSPDMQDNDRWVEITTRNLLELASCPLPEDKADDDRLINIYLNDLRSHFGKEWPAYRDLNNLPNKRKIKRIY